MIKGLTQLLCEEGFGGAEEGELSWEKHHHVTAMAGTGGFSK